MATEPALTFSLASVVQEVLQQHASRLDANSASRKTEETSLRRYEAAGWLRKTVGVVRGKDLPAEPSEGDFRIGLRSGIILCSVLNKIQPGTVKVLEKPSDSVIVPDGGTSTYQYQENIKNFLVAMEDMGLPTFGVSDLEQGGNSERVVNCVLELKSYAERKVGGGSGSGKYSGVANAKPPMSGKPITRKNSEPFMKCMITVPSGDRDGGYMSDPGQDRSERASFSLNSMVRQYLSDKNPEEILSAVESLLSKVMEECEHHMQIRCKMYKTTGEDKAPSETVCSILEAASINEMVKETEDEPAVEEEHDDLQDKNDVKDEQDVRDEQNVKVERDIQDEHKEQNKREEIYEKMCNEHEKREHEKSIHKISISKQQNIVARQNRSIQELKNIVHQTKLGMQLMQSEHQKEIINLSKHLYSLTCAASGYHKVLEENRKLYNVVQDLKGNIRVYCRVRPFLGGQPSHYSSVGNVEDGSISIITPSKYGKEGKKTFNFNRAFGPSATQGEVFADTQPLIRSVLDGYNVCIFAYGQTGSGKTFTMSGPDELNDETIGVNYRALGDLFYLSDQRKDTISYEISVQMLEIYNEQVRDLLTPDAANKRLDIRNSSLNGINVPDANLVRVSCTSDVISLMNLGHKNRAVGSTAMNDRSSRSHSCLTVHVQGKNLTSGGTVRGSMHLVDLAGSERADKTEATGDRLKEAQHINKSLSALGDVISALAQKSPHVPYRNSKLTQLLQDSLGGQAKTLMFVHISPEAEALGETLSTLKFAERVSTVELGAARVNKDSSDVKELKEQIASLKAALARKEGEAEQFNNGGNETPKHKSYASSPPVTRPSSGGSRKLSKDDSSSLDDQKHVASTLKSQSIDLHDMGANSPQWQPVTSERKEEDKESISGDWGDNKISMNRNDSITSDDSVVGAWEVESKQSSPRLSPTFLSEPSKISLDNSSHKKDNQDNEELQRPSFDMTTTDESDEHEIATVTSDSSESDLHWPPQIPKPITISSGLGIKAKKKTNLRSIKNSDSRSMIPSFIPAPVPVNVPVPVPVSSRKQQPSPVTQGRKLPGSSDVRRRFGNSAK
ncbi:kinesin-like protein KIN-14I [Vigna unguiculata]|uniref:kinesin-like protein KIN-14I n=1 Tax=Vigna unguiculata TaxID=3917 RepID=UPI001015FD1D|nr:kinesin-like protein KIN-14I [Vigna unguiculata]